MSEHMQAIPIVIGKLSYDQLTGHFTWARSPSPQISHGQRAGGLKTNGYRRILFEGVRVSEHRLAWMFVYGGFPTSFLDHINGIRDDNRIANLRLSSPSLNRQNQRSPRSDNKLGALGVCRADGKFLAQIQLAGKKYKIGRYLSIDEAHAAYVSKKRELHPAGTI